MKYLVFDSGPLISLTLNGLLDIIVNLKKNFKGEFVITNAVKYEVIDRPKKIKKYKLESLKMEELIDKKIIRLSSDFIDEESLNKETQKILKESSDIISYHNDGKKIKILQEGEVSCLAFCKLIKDDCLLVIDERTTRFLIEKPKKLEELMERKLHSNLDFNNEAAQKFKGYKTIRSAELLYIAYKKDILGMKKSRDLLDAMLYGVKFKGTALSTKEIELIKQMV